MTENSNKLVSIALLTMVVAMMLVLVWLAADSRVRTVDVEMRANLLHRVESVVHLVNPKLAAKLTFTTEDYGGAAFAHIREQMIAAGNLFPQRSVYCMALRHDRIVLGPSNQAAGGMRINAAWEEDARLTAAAQQLFADKRPAVVGPVTDDYGTFYVAIAPLLDPVSGELLMAVAIEADAGAWQVRIKNARKGPLLVMGVLILLMLGVAIAIRRHNRQWRQHSLLLQQWVLLPTALTMLVGLIIFWGYQNQLGRENARQEILRVTEQAENEWNRNLDAQVQLLKVQIGHLAQDPVLQDVWQQRDLTALLELTHPLYEEMKREYSITHFYFVEPERVCFLRVHQPDRRGDLIDRDTMLAAVRTGEDAWGTELGPLGTFTLRYVRPWRREGRVIGYLELGMEIEGLVTDVAQAMDIDVVTLIRKQYSTKAKFEAGRKAFGFVGNWESYRDFVVTHQTTPELPAAVTAWVEHGHTPFAQEIMANTRLGKRTFLCSLLHLPDVGGRDVADLIVMLDVTARANAERSALLLNLGLAVMMCGCILVLLWSVTGAAEWQLGRAFSLLRESEESYRRQFADNSEVMLLLDPKDGRILDANEAAVAFYGYTRKRLLSMKITDINSRAVSEVKLSMEAVVIGHKRHFEFQHRLADGTLREVEITTSLIRFGERMILHTIIHDITTYKKVVADLTEKIRQLEDAAWKNRSV